MYCTKWTLNLCEVDVKNNATIYINLQQSKRSLWCDYIRM